ncbi:MAG: hypothetical protein EA377_12755 [Phycisphaerales bacterium]|nr:MAG: hypothetical protein EA377_12755 [Phycisphaerales bacterium]
MTTREIAHTFQVSPAWARRVRQTRREEGRTTPLPRGGARVIKIDMERLAELVREQPDVAERREQWKAEQTKYPGRRMIFIDETYSGGCMSSGSG